MTIDEARKLFKQVCLWGYPLHSHTHSYEHYAFQRAFDALGFKTLWVEDKPSHGTNWENTLFIPGSHEQVHVPIRDDCWYLIHNCPHAHYEPVYKHVGQWQVFTNPILQRLAPNGPINYVKPFHYREEGDSTRPDWPTLYMPWATELLPDEIDLAWARYPRGKTCDWIGTLGKKSQHHLADGADGEFSNYGQIEPFIRAAAERGYQWRVGGMYSGRTVGMEENRFIVRQSFLAPTIVGAWQKRVGYIPTRAYKNCSYGALLLTNSKETFESMEGIGVYNEDAYQLFYDAESHAQDFKMIEDGMKLVIEKHTYFNRIASLLELFP